MFFDCSVKRSVVHLCMIICRAVVTCMHACTHTHTHTCMHTHTNTQNNTHKHSHSPKQSQCCPKDRSQCTEHNRQWQVGRAWSRSWGPSPSAADAAKLSGCLQRIPQSPSAGHQTAPTAIHRSFEHQQSSSSFFFFGGGGLKNRFVCLLIQPTQPIGTKLVVKIPWEMTVYMYML